MRDLVGAVAFLTRVPVTHTISDERDLARSVPWFGVVGALVGLLVGVVAVLADLVVSHLAAAAIAVAVGVVVTGAFHEDGLADTADGFWGGFDAGRRLEILRDSRLGTYGTLALVLSMLVRVALLRDVMVGQPTLATVVVLVVAHGWSRLGAVGLMALVGPARPGGLGAAYLAHLPSGTPGLLRLAAPTVLVVPAVAIGLDVAGTGVAVAGGIGALLVGGLAAAAIAGLVAARVARDKVGGITGDVLGATQQLAELGVLFVAVATAI